MKVCKIKINTPSEAFSVVAVMLSYDKFGKRNISYAADSREERKELMRETVQQENECSLRGHFGEEKETTSAI
jgi:hypothetical protein